MVGFFSGRLGAGRRSRDELLYVEVFFLSCAQVSAVDVHTKHWRWWCVMK